MNKNRLLPVIQQDPCCASPNGEAVTLRPIVWAHQLADQLRALADVTRLRMLDLLAQQAEPLCVCDITAQFDLQQPTISHHLRILREAGLVDYEKRGTWAHYWVTAEGKRRLAALAAFE